MARADADQRGGGCLNQGGGLGQEGANDMMGSVNVHLLVSIELTFRRDGVYAVLNVASPCTRYTGQWVTRSHGSLGVQQMVPSEAPLHINIYMMWCLPGAIQ